MTKKNKNIIVIIIIFVLLVSLGLTIYFAGCEKKSSIKYNDTRISLPRQDNRNNQRKYNIPNKRDNSNSPNEKEESDTDINKEKTSLEETDNNVSYLSNNRFNRQIMIPSDNRSTRGLSSKYVVLISIETFLLGASIMYLIMNNIDNEHKIVDATIVEKETKKERK